MLVCRRFLASFQTISRSSKKIRVVLEVLQPCERSAGFWCSEANSASFCYTTLACLTSWPANPCRRSRLTHQHIACKLVSSLFTASKQSSACLISSQRQSSLCTKHYKAGFRRWCGYGGGASSPLGASRETCLTADKRKQVQERRASQ